MAKEKPKFDTAPLRACLFDQTPILGFAEPDEDERFTIVAYSGQVIPNHFFWGNVAFDLGGVKFNKKVTAVLEEHLRDSRIGYTTKQEITNRVVVEGRFLSNDIAQRIRRDIKEGFPMQASVFIEPSRIERVADGEQTEVNGHPLKGPGTVFRKSVIHEISMCTLGADSNTQSKAYAEGGEAAVKFSVMERKFNMDETKAVEMTAEGFAADHPEIHGEIVRTAREEGRAEGEAKSRELFVQFAERFAEDPTFCIEQFKSGIGIEEAIAAYADKLRADRQQLATEKAELAKQVAAKKVDPAVTEFADQQEGKGGDGSPETPEEKWTAEFNKSEDLQGEYKDIETYLAYKRAEAAGRVDTRQARG